MPSPRWKDPHCIGAACSVQAPCTPLPPWNWLLGGWRQLSWCTPLCLGHLVPHSEILGKRLSQEWPRRDAVFLLATPQGTWHQTHYNWSVDGNHTDPAHSAPNLFICLHLSSWQFLMLFKELWSITVYLFWCSNCCNLSFGSPSELVLQSVWHPSVRTSWPSCTKRHSGSSYISPSPDEPSSLGRRAAFIVLMNSGHPHHCGGMLWDQVFKAYPLGSVSAEDFRTKRFTVYSCCVFILALWGQLTEHVISWHLREAEGKMVIM